VGVWVVLVVSLDVGLMRLAGWGRFELRRVIPGLPVWAEPGIQGFPRSLLDSGFRFAAPE